MDYRLSKFDFRNLRNDLRTQTYSQKRIIFTFPNPSVDIRLCEMRKSNLYLKNALILEINFLKNLKHGNIRDLNLANNQISYIPIDLFEKNSFYYLKKLNLENNLLVELELWPFYLNHANINLQYNKIINFTNNFNLNISQILQTKPCFQNNFVDLRKNEIKNFTDSTLQQYYLKDFKTELTCFKRLLLENNQIICDCDRQMNLIKYSTSFMQKLCNNTKNKHFSINSCLEKNYTTIRFIIKGKSTMSTTLKITTISIQRTIIRAIKSTISTTSTRVLTTKMKIPSKNSIIYKFFTGLTTTSTTFKESLKNITATYIVTNKTKIVTVDKSTKHKIDIVKPSSKNVIKILSAIPTTTSKPKYLKTINFSNFTFISKSILKTTSQHTKTSTTKISTINSGTRKVAIITTKFTTISTITKSTTSVATTKITKNNTKQQMPSMIKSSTMTYSIGPDSITTIFKKQKTTTMPNKFLLTVTLTKMLNSLISSTKSIRMEFDEIYKLSTKTKSPITLSTTGMYKKILVTNLKTTFTSTSIKLVTATLSTMPFKGTPNMITTIVPHKSIKNRVSKTAIKATIMTTSQTNSNRINLIEIYTRRAQITTPTSINTTSAKETKKSTLNSKRIVSTAIISSSKSVTLSHTILFSTTSVISSVSKSLLRTTTQSLPSWFNEKTSTHLVASSALINIMTRPRDLISKNHSSSKLKQNSVKQIQVNNVSRKGEKSNLFKSILITSFFLFITLSLGVSLKYFT